jgi:hypothetical protein
VSERPDLEVADVFRAHAPALLARAGKALSAEQRRAVRDVLACRTAALGGHAYRCDACGHAAIASNSCRNRHCPKCQGSQTAAWLRREASYLLPVPYYHVVFTLPEAVATLVWQNRRLGYGLLFRAVPETLREVAANPKHLGAEVGVLTVLHTWGQDLHYHPHLHAVVTGGGLACDPAGRVEARPRWVACRPGFFLPVRVLSRVYRGKFLALVRQAQAAGQWSFFGELAGLVQPAAFASWLAAQYRREWVVYAKPPFGGPEQVLKYLAAYTHRVALSNRRLVALEEGRVTFTAKDYAAGGRRRPVTLSGEEFVRRWLQHVLPRGFVKIRHGGLLANRSRAEKLALCRSLLAAGAVLQVVLGLAWPAALTSAPAVAERCPRCAAGTWRRVADVAPAGPAAPESADTS